MPRVVPSQIVALIDKLFPWAKNQKEDDHREAVTKEQSCSVAAVLDLVQQLPPEFITLTSDAYSELVASIAGLRTQIENWQSHGGQPLFRIPGLRSVSPVTLIRQALAQCPDQIPSPGTSALAFISDGGLRENLRIDMSATNDALRNGEWKAATVLAGSVVETLLLWALQEQNHANVSAAVGRLGLKVSWNLEDWVLYQYIEVAAELKIISPETATQCRLAKDFRNLIHPGRAKRLAQACNRGTALSAVAAVEHVVNDLTP